jgi:hypothetical protein
MNLKVSSPCPESWDRMAGNERVRYCGRCNLNVYNLAIMSRQEIEALVRKTGGQLCGRLYMRGDRTATLRDCAGGARRQWTRRAVAVGVLLVLAAVSWMLRQIDTSDRSMHPPLIRKVLNWIDPEPEKRTIIMGKMACPVPPPPPPPPQAPSAP